MMLMRDMNSAVTHVPLNGSEMRRAAAFWIFRRGLIVHDGSVVTAVVMMSWWIVHRVRCSDVVQGESAD